MNDSEYRHSDHLKNRHILLVDDEKELLDMVLSILEGEGYHNITTARSVRKKSAGSGNPGCHASGWGRFLSDGAA